WPGDAHFTMYTSPQNTRLLKDGSTGNEGISFSLAACDFDYDAHAGRPTDQSYVDHVFAAAYAVVPPNIVYSTRGGARWVWLIKRIDNAATFEQHYQGLISKIGKQWLQVGPDAARYHLDSNCKDWTRLFRLPLVIRTDEQDGTIKEEQQESHIRLLHSRVLDLQKLKPVIQRKAAQPLYKRSIAIDDSR